MTIKERFKQTIEYFLINQPIAETELTYTNPFELIVAVILSAQCTDKRVNLITPPLLERYPTAESMARAIIEVKPENQEAFEAMLDESMACEKIGTVGGDSIRVNDVVMSMEQLQDNYFNTFKRVIERDL